MRNHRLIILVTFFIIGIAATSSYGQLQCGEWTEYPPSSAHTKFYTIEPDPPEGSEFPHWVEECPGDTSIGCYAWDYVVSGDLSKIAHVSLGIAYDCTNYDINVIPEDDSTKYSDPCEGDPVSNGVFGKGICNNRIVSITPQPVTGQFTIYTDTKSAGTINVAVVTGKGVEFGEGPLIGPGYEIPEILIYNEVEELVFGDVKFCLKRTSPFEKCPSEIWGLDDTAATCEEIMEDTNNLLGGELLSGISADGEGAVFCGDENQICPMCKLKFGDESIYCLTIAGRRYCYYY